MPTLKYSRETPEAKTLIRALQCPQASPWRKLALRIARRALREPTRRAAAAKLGMHETTLSTLLAKHPELTNEQNPGTSP